MTCYVTPPLPYYHPQIVYYRDTNGDWTPEKTELVYIDFMPKTPKLCNSQVDYTLKTCK
jgi:hypothetical protein